MSLLQRPTAGGRTRIQVSPESFGWTFLSFQAVYLAPGDRIGGSTGDEEVALVPLRGEWLLDAGGEQHVLSRASVFAERPHVAYLPPGTDYHIVARGEVELAWGGAPAEGGLPPRVIRPDEMRVEIRGGANVTRQITHLLAPPLPAARLVLFEVYTPSGNWSSWPPHRHDGRDDSPYLEEVYYYRIEPREGFALQRVYAPDAGLDEVLLARDGDAVLVPEGHHPVVAAPGSNVYYLNVLAGPERSTAVADDPAYAWMRGDWTGRALALPIDGEE